MPAGRNKSDAGQSKLLDTVTAQRDGAVAGPEQKQVMRYSDKESVCLLVHNTCLLVHNLTLGLFLSQADGICTYLVGCTHL